MAGLLGVGSVSVPRIHSVGLPRARIVPLLGRRALADVPRAKAVLHPKVHAGSLVIIAVVVIVDVIVARNQRASESGAAEPDAK
jgi:hypothetical protein